MKKIIVSGTQATGVLHIGNYLGSIINWVKMQDDYESFFFLADLHAITIERRPEELRDSILNTAAIYLAAGLSPSKITIFAQSMVKEHSEMAWLLNCITPLGWLKRMTQFKDKAGKKQDNASFGLLSYPILMAADILLYKADIVPVGEDQKQHLELTRDIAGVINRKFDRQVFNLPEPLISGPAVRIMSLRDGTKKMSKSDPSPFTRINLTDGADEICQKIKKAKTDNIPEISYQPKERPEIGNLVNIYSSFTNKNIAQIINEYQGKGLAKFKNDLAEIIIASLRPITEKYNHLIKDQDYLCEMLRDGAEKAQSKASVTIKEVKELFGFIS